MNFGIYKHRYREHNDMILIFDDFLEEYFFECHLGLDLCELIEDNSSFLTTVTEHALEKNYIAMEDETELLFDEKVNKYIKCVLIKRNKILERAKLYNKEKEYTKLLDEIYEKFYVLMED